MRVLVTLGGELAAIVDPVCDNPDRCGRGGVGLESAYHIADVVVADRDDITPGDLFDACRELLHRTGWTDIDDVSADIADETAQAAARFPVGTRLQPRYDYRSNQWDYVDLGGASPRVEGQ